MKIIAFGASSSKHSINKSFAEFTANQFSDATIEVLDLNNYQLPLFSVDIEAEIGSPDVVKSFLTKIEEADLLVISMAEHNGSYTVAFKNLFDWTSRLKMKLFEHKNIILLATSPGPRGAISVLEAAKNRFPIHGGTIIASFSLPSFDSNFDSQKGITDAALKQEFDAMIATAKTKL
ncbi:MAG: NAD(P)H-dependent oxidoreductase [Paludibacteraceae bacterium]|nr:NAD(P)H-dependent oxidoreductase [Paludibacteraceae bacterium]